MTKAKVVHQITLVPQLLDKSNGASVHVSCVNAVIDAEGKVFTSAEESAADLQLQDADILEKCRELRDLVAQRLADSSRMAVRAAGDSKAQLTQPAAAR